MGPPRTKHRRLLGQEAAQVLAEDLGRYYGMTD